MQRTERVIEGRPAIVVVLFVDDGIPVMWGFDREVSDGYRSQLRWIAIPEVVRDRMRLSEVKVHDSRDRKPRFFEQLADRGIALTLALFNNAGYDVPVSLPGTA
jgi:hypothetical protein